MGSIYTQMQIQNSKGKPFEADADRQADTPSWQRC